MNKYDHGLMHYDFVLSDSYCCDCSDMHININYIRSSINRSTNGFTCMTWHVAVLDLDFFLFFLVLRLENGGGAGNLENRWSWPPISLSLSLFTSLIPRR